MGCRGSCRGYAAWSEWSEILTFGLLDMGLSGVFTSSKTYMSFFPLCAGERPQALTHAGQELHPRATSQPPHISFYFRWGGRALLFSWSFGEVESAREGVEEELMAQGWRSQVVLVPPAVLSRQQPLGVALGSWNVLYAASSPAPPLPPSPTLLPGVGWSGG